MKKKLILITILATLAWLWLGTTQQASGQYADVDTIWSVKAGTTTYLCQIAKFTPDYNYVLAAVGFQSWGTIRKYDAKTGEFISAFKDSTLEEIQDMVCFNDMSKVVTQTTCFIDIWDFNTERLIKRLDFRKTKGYGGTSGFAVSNDNKYMVLCYAGGDYEKDSLLLINLENYQIEKVLDTTKLYGRSAFSPDGKNFITREGYFDNQYNSYFSTIYIWSAETWKMLSKMITVQGLIEKCVFSHDNKYLLCLTDQSSYLFDWQTKQIIREYKPVYKNYIGLYHNRVVFSNDSKNIIFGSYTMPKLEEFIFIIDVQTDSLKRAYRISSGSGLDITSDDSQILTVENYIILMNSGLENTDVEENISSSNNELNIFYKNDSITLNFQLNSSCNARLKIHDLKGVLSRIAFTF